MLDYTSGLLFGMTAPFVFIYSNSGKLNEKLNEVHDLTAEKLFILACS